MDQEKMKLNEMDLEPVAGGINWNDLGKVDPAEHLNPRTDDDRPGIIDRPKPAPNPFADRSEE